MTRQKYIKVLLTDQEYAMVMTIATRLGLSASAFLRQVAIEYDQDMVNDHDHDHKSMVIHHDHDQAHDHTAVKQLLTEIADLKTRLLVLEASQLGIPTDIMDVAMDDATSFSNTNNGTTEDTTTMKNKKPSFPETATTEELLEIMNCLHMDLKEIAAKPLDKQCRAMAFLDPSGIGYKTEDGKTWHRCHPDEAMAATDKRLFGKPLREYLQDNNGKI